MPWSDLCALIEPVYRGWRLGSLDGSTSNVADENANAQAFGWPGAGRGVSVFPQLRFVSLGENGTCVLFGMQMGGYRSGETTLSQARAAGAARRDAVLLGQRAVLWLRLLVSGAGYGGRSALATEDQCPPGVREALGRRLLGEHPVPQQQRSALARQRRGRAGGRIPPAGGARGRADLPACDEYSRPQADPRQGTGDAVPGALGDRDRLGRVEGVSAPGQDILRSKTPDLVCQELYGLMLAHFAIRGLMHEAALTADEDPDGSRFCMRCAWCGAKWYTFHAIPPSAEEKVS